MKTWSRYCRTALALTAVLSLAWQPDAAVYAKDICQDAGATPAPTFVTPSPTTPSPTTPLPTKPKTPAPTTPLPTKPITPAPSTPAPTTPAPTTPAPTTPAPTTPLPTKPKTPAPTTPSPTTPVPPTPAPTTPAPTTPAPTTPAPTTPAPTTPAPTTPAPTTPFPGVGCGTQLKQIYFHGFDLEEFPLATPAECCAACNANPECKLYTHFKSSTTGVIRCLLKTAPGEKTNYGDSRSVTVVSAYANATPVPTPAPTPEPTPEPTPAPTPTCGKQLKQIYFHGFDISEFTLETPEECCTECAREPKCVLYTYFYSKTTGKKRCLLKSAPGEKTNYGDSQSVIAVSAYVTRPTPAPTPTPTPAPSPVCAITTGQYCGNAQGTLCCDATSYCQPWNDSYYQCIGLPDGCGNLETDVDFYGGDIRSVSNVLPWDCCRLCQQTDGCAVYTFVNLDPSGPTCYLKTSAAGRVRKVGALSGRRTNYSPLPTPTPVPTTVVPTPSPSASVSSCGQVLKNIYFHGFDIKELALNGTDACCDACAATPGCVLYTHFASRTTDRRVCKLKSGAGEKTNYADSASVTAASAYVKAPLPPPSVAPVIGA